MGDIPAEEVVLKARRTGDDPHAPFAPAPIEDAVAAITEKKPDLVFAPHVEEYGPDKGPFSAIPQLIVSALYRRNGVA